jgi:hypothetical protein
MSPTIPCDSAWLDTISGGANVIDVEQDLEDEQIVLNPQLIEDD